MAPLDLEGETLGGRHRHYNQLMKEAFKQTSRPDKINPNDADIENLLKIDVASNNKDLEYILDVLRSDDMLLVSRVLKNGEWLLQPSFEHIFNAEYLHDNLLRTMPARAGSKLLLFIRLHLKDESRADQFYRYYQDKNLKQAFKWLPYCSLSVAEKAIEDYGNRIDVNTIKRLCERSVNILSTYIGTNNKSNYNYKLTELLNSTTFLLNTDLYKYLDIIEAIREETWNRYGLTFNSKSTSLVMQKCPQRILDNFEKYVGVVDLETLARHIKPEDIKGFLAKQMTNKSIKEAFGYEILKYFVRRMPKEGRFEFIKKVFIDKEQSGEVDRGVQEDYVEMCAMSMQCSVAIKCRGRSSNTSSANVYQWYRFAPFETAFADLKKLIRAESSPVERNAILSVLLTCAGKNPKHIHELVMFYQKCHINEPFKFKIHFINQVISKTETYRFDSETWDILNKIFHSMEVYIESDNDVSSCIQSIIVHQTLHNESIPEIIAKKFDFSTMKSLQNKLSSDGSEKVFNFLYRYLETKLLDKNMSDKTEFREAIDLFEDLRTLIVDWKRQLADYPLIEAKGTDLIKIMTDQGWTKEFTWLYEKDKWWRRRLFAQSLVLRPSEETLLNALKHQPGLLEQHKEAVQTICCDDNTTLSKLLAKLRVYWPRTWARDWTAAYRARQTTAGGHRALVRGLCALLPPTELMQLLRHYAPQNTKIEWAAENEIELSLRKNMALNMHRARPSPPLDVALLYARGDYLQFAMPALSALLHNLSVVAVRQALPTLLDAPVSLRKHGLRLAFAKLPSQELKPMFSRIWDTTKNSTIRTVIFNQTFYLLCREKQPELIQELWGLMSLFIDNLTREENKEIYVTFNKVGDVPIDVRAQLLMKSYRFLKTLPAKANCDNIIDSVIFNHTRDVMDKLDNDFIINDMIPYLTEKLASDRWYGCLSIISALILSALDERSQISRYDTSLVPLLRKSFKQWNESYGDRSKHKHTFSEIIGGLLEHLCNDVTDYVLKRGMVIPVKLFAEIQREIEEHLDKECNYEILTFWKLSACFVKILEEHKASLPTVKDYKEPTIRGGCRREQKDSDNVTKLDQALIEVSPKFSKTCLQYLKEDINTYFPSVYLLFGSALEKMLDGMNLSESVKAETEKKLLSEDFIPSYLTVIKIMPTYMEKEERWKEVTEMIKSHPSREVKMHYYKKINRK